MVQVTQVFLTFETKADVSLDSESQIVVPKVSLCKPLFDLYKPKDKRKIFRTSILSVFNDTYHPLDMFLLCSMKVHQNSTHKTESLTKCEYLKVKTEKIISISNICFSIKHPQFSKNDIRRSGQLFDLLFYHYKGDKLSLHFTSDNNIPDVKSDNSLELLGNLIL